MSWGALARDLNHFLGHLESLLLAVRHSCDVLIRSAAGSAEVIAEGECRRSQGMQTGGSGGDCRHRDGIDCRGIARNATQTSQATQQAIGRAKQGDKEVDQTIHFYHPAGGGHAGGYPAPGGQPVGLFRDSERRHSIKSMKEG